MTAARWALWVEGRWRTRVTLADGGEDALAELTPRAGYFGRPARGRAVDRDGGRWEVERRATTVTVRRDGLPVARAEDDELTVGDARYRWSVAWDGRRRAAVRAADDDAPLVLVTPGTGANAPWAVIDVADGAPEPLAVALAASFVLMGVEASRGLRDLQSGTGSTVP